jgi:hypothetical protein
MKIICVLLLAMSVFGTLPARAGSKTQGAKPESPFACDTLALTPADRKRHFDELGPSLRGILQNVRGVPNGYEFGFPVDPASIQLVAEWAAGERLCCPFFEIDMRMDREHGGFWLRLTGRSGTKEFIKADFVEWFKKLGVA